jgi:hypothetical protein
MDGYYFLRVKKDYASAIIEDLRLLDAVELLDAGDNIPEWQKKEVLSRLQVMNDNPGSGVDWDTVLNRIKQLAAGTTVV